MHIERFGNDEVQGIELGKCFIFPKLDGTNGSVWLHDEEVHAGSRNRHLSIDNDNAGFLSAMRSDENIRKFLENNSHLRLYGEWLVPHSLKTYRPDAWKQFYIFDVYEEDRAIPFPEYEELLSSYNLNIIHPITIIKNAQYEDLLSQLDKNTFLIGDGKGIGEGIVIKNYEFQNRFGRTVWAKIITNSFKEEHTKTMGPSILDGQKMIEELCVNEFITKHLVDKVYAKIVNECEGWNSRFIPRLLNTVFYDLVNEESWNIVKKYKNPTINFKTLYSITVNKIKELRPELF